LAEYIIEQAYPRPHSTKLRTGKKVGQPDQDSAQSKREKEKNFSNSPSEDGENIHKIREP
jgi:hypothetical protein